MSTIDLSYLKSIADGDDSIIIELVNIFLEQIEEFTECFETHFVNKEWKNISGLAHKAKSSVISMGMTELGEVDLKNLELISKFLLIKELKNKSDLSDKEKEDIINMEKSFSKYPESKLFWANENSTEEVVYSIISKFKNICQLAKTEINFFLDNNSSDFKN